MTIRETLDRLKREDPILKLPTKHFIGSYAVMENGYISVYDKLKIVRLSSEDQSYIDIIIDIVDIVKVGQYYKNGTLEFLLRPKACSRLNKYLNQFDHSYSIKDGKAPSFEVQMDLLTNENITIFQSFFSSIASNVDKNEIEEVQIGSPQNHKRLTRKKKAENALQSNNQDEPVQKKPRKRQLPSIIDLCGEEPPPPRSQRSLRTRRGLSKGKEQSVPVDDDDDDLKAAIEASLIECGAVKEADEVVKKKRKPKEPKPDPYAHIDQTIELFRYPVNHWVLKEITVKMEDYLCLGKAEYLSDVIIDFFFSYIYNEKFTPEMREKTYIFPTLFYTMYSTSSDYSGWNSDENANKSALQKRYERIQGMLDPCVNIFEKEFLVFPLFTCNHWFLCIVCFPLLTQNLLFETNEPTDDEVKRNIRRYHDPTYKLVPLKSSSILTFDSIKSNSGRRTTAMKHIRGFLTSHYERHYKEQFPIGRLTSCSVPCPVQPNSVDCGCFIIEFFERFFVSDPFDDFRLPLNKADWFNPQDVHKGKRREIADVIRDKMQIYAQQQNFPPVELPELTFVSETLNDSVVEIVEENGNSNNNSNEENGNSNNNGSEDGNSNNNNCDDDMNGNNNNNDEAFNNNNDFNCLNSNQVSVAPPSEQVQAQESPEIFSDQHETAEQSFARIKGLERTSYMNIHNNDNDGILKEIETETIPFRASDDNCTARNEQVADVEMQEPPEPPKPIEDESKMLSSEKLHEDFEMNDISEQPEVTLIESSPESNGNQTAKESPSKQPEVTLIDSLPELNGNQTDVALETNQESDEIIGPTQQEEDTPQKKSDYSEVENVLKETEERIAKMIENETDNASKSAEPTNIEHEDPAVSVGNQNVQDNFAGVKDNQPDNLPASKPDDGPFDVSKKIEETCDKTIILSD